MTNVITICSYNIWFDETLSLERTVGLIELLNQTKPDVICLQEVKPNIYQLLITLLNDYRYHFPKKISKSYGCVTFSKYPISKCLEFEYKNSSMGRSLIITKIDYPYHTISDDGVSVDKVDIVIGNSHFESLFKRNTINEVKIEQYRIARELLEKLYNEYHNVILCSDTNVMAHEESKFNEQYIDNSWYDSWICKGSALNKYTYDTDANVNLNIRLSKFKCKSRIDRILFKCDNCFIEEFNMLKGTSEILEPSDHFGVSSKYLIVKELPKI
ncbi:endonuclease/exonuclease/phosphatase [Fadolivirus algeromassiliense]|jgi:exonuclease III|uniref:Endonuclease/exonuclease/phosphatase n=1 Tax=Fadolivirus FV1/VV64 TaxID=3070911 RepID=A0A7D3R133_9VIRU|nr:endonuclease/exonuclease/phosphatase [Fadolivirus algeromassiliense]QKF94141.1 endonuclease/exonuclease/phosphatase [Fadolivirus FV1/VV64]